MTDISGPTPHLFREEELRHLLDREVQRSTRYQDFLSLCLVRLAYRGVPHPTEIQSGVALRVAAMLRTTDIVGVLGDDIAVLLVHTPEPEALVIAERIRDRVRSEPFWQEPLGPGARVELGIGLAHFPSDATTDAGLLRHAQGRLEASLAASQLGRGGR